MDEGLKYIERNDEELREEAASRTPVGMTDYMAVGIAEGFEEAESEERVIEAWQHLVDTGLAWRLQGWFGRTAAQLIEAGVIRARS